ncbi:MAG: pentapeptide repeat-containing protein [Thermomicrobiales bacterium]
MDQESFDRLARLLAVGGTRRVALGAMLGLGAAGVQRLAEAKPGHRGQRQRGKERQGRGAGRVTSQAASCGNPKRGSNLNGCNFSNADLSGLDLSSSSMVGTNFTDANLCSTNLRSSTLRNAIFNGANLTNADLRSSACKNTQFNDATVYCNTRLCDGSTRNDDCPRGVAPEDVCCDASDCEIGQVCERGVCALLAATPVGNVEVSGQDVWLVSSTTAAVTYAKLEFEVGAGVEFADIYRLESTYTSQIAPGCRNGSPRFELGTLEGDIHIPFSIENECSTAASETPNYIHSELAYFDTSRIPQGSASMDYFSTRELLASRELQIKRIALVVDGGRADAVQRVKVSPRVGVGRRAEEF